MNTKDEEPPMIRPDRASSFLLAFLLAIVLPFAELAHGEDDAPREDTPAAKAFRDAWWQETGAGALDKALKGYRAALAAEGSNAVRARSLYRMGLVLQRMGKMDEALNAMKRLATEFPEQAALLAKAKQRLDEWTAIDLREQFPEWYRRYQYSPEFQAKIVDLVLKLGAPKQDVQRQAKQELLTIGEPAVPALEQHAASANTTIRRIVMEILLDLGRLPPAASLFKSSGWLRQQAFWEHLHAADDATKRAYRAAAEANPKDFRAPWVTATLDGESAVAALVRTADIQGQNANAFVYGVLAPWLDEEPSSTLTASLRAAVLDPKVSASLRGQLAQRLHAYHRFTTGEPHPFGLTPDEIVQWVGSDDAGVRDAAFQLLRMGYLESQAVLDAVVAYIDGLEATARIRKEASGAIFGILRMRKTEEGADGAVRAVTRLLESGGWGELDGYPLQDWQVEGRGSPVVPMQVLARAITSARGNPVKGAASSWFSHRNPIPRDERWDQLLAWSTAARDSEIRREAIRIAAQAATGDLERLTAPVIAPGVSPKFGRHFMQGLFRNRAYARLPWNEETVTRLLEITVREPRRKVGKVLPRNVVVGGQVINVRMPYATPHGDVLLNVFHDGAHAATFFRAAVRYPDRFDGAFWNLVGESWSHSAEHRDLARRSLVEGWGRWQPDQREQGLHALLHPLTFPRGDAATDVVLRRLLASEGNTPAVRSLLLEYVSKLSLADVRAAFDFAKVADVDAAASLVPMLPATREVFDAFVPALRKEGKAYDLLADHFRDSEDDAIVRDLIARLLAHGSSGANGRATDMLIRRKQAEDLPIWIGALTHREAKVRKLAAERLGRLYNDDAIKALARAVDDADPDVRDAALESLAKIEKTEKEKERWRRFAKEGAGK